MMQKNFEPELPEGYTEAKVVDAKNGKFIIGMNVVSFIVFVVVLVGLYLLIGEPMEWRLLFDHFIGWFLTVIFMLIYLVLHELLSTDLPTVC